MIGASREDINSLEAGCCMLSLEHFTREFWSTIIDNELIWSTHMTVMCDEIQDLYNRVFDRKPKINDLIINVPPGTSKTTICSIMATCWAFANMPSIRILLVS